MRKFVVAILLLSWSCGNVPQGAKLTTANVASVHISPPDANAAEPAIAADGKGNIYVLWVDHSDEKHANLFFRKFDNASKPVGDPVRVNPDATAVKSWFGDPPTIAVGPNGAIYVGWNRAYSDAQGNDLVVSVSRDAGRSFDGPVKVNDDVEPASHGMHSLAVDANGRIYLAWLDERNIKPPEQMSPGHHDAEPNSEVFFASSDDDGKTFGQNKRLASEVCPCCKTTLLTSADSQVYAAWRQVLPGDFRHMAVAHSSDRGQTFSEGVIVSDDKWQITACPVSGAALSLNRDNSVTVAWYTAGNEGQAGLYTARTTDGGKTFMSRVLFSNTATTGTPTILNIGPGSLIAFATKDGNTQINALGGNGSQVRSIPHALCPTAATSGELEFVAYVTKENGKNSVWLARL